MHKSAYIYHCYIHYLFGRFSAGLKELIVKKSESEEVQGEKKTYICTYLYMYSFFQQACNLRLIMGRQGDLIEKLPTLFMLNG